MKNLFEEIESKFGKFHWDKRMVWSLSIGENSIKAFKDIEGEINSISLNFDNDRTYFVTDKPEPKLGLYEELEKSGMIKVDRKTFIQKVSDVSNGIMR